MTLPENPWDTLAHEASDGLETLRKKAAEYGGGMRGFAHAQLISDGALVRLLLTSRRAGTSSRTDQLIDGLPGLTEVTTELATPARGRIPPVSVADLVDLPDLPVSPLVSRGIDDSDVDE